MSGGFDFERLDRLASGNAGNASPEPEFSRAPGDGRAKEATMNGDVKVMDYKTDFPELGGAAPASAPTWGAKKTVPKIRSYQINRNDPTSTMGDGFYSQAAYKQVGQGGPPGGGGQPSQEQIQQQWQQYYAQQAAAQAQGPPQGGGGYQATQGGGGFGAQETNSGNETEMDPETHHHLLSKPSAPSAPNGVETSSGHTSLKQAKKIITPVRIPVKSLKPDQPANSQLYPDPSTPMVLPGREGYGSGCGFPR